MSSLATPVFKPSEYWLEQDYEQSMRLHLQHWIWQYQLSYALHPKIEVSRETPLKIADVGAGNGAWVMEVAKRFDTKEVDILGFDITDVHFPNAAWLPDNIRFDTWNAYSDLPPQYEDAFDVVHLRTLSSTVIENKVDPLLSNCLKMLKPGGHLQWDESDASTFTAYAPNDSVKADAANQLIALQNFTMRFASKMLPDWLYSLGSTLEQRGCDVLAHDEYEPDRRLARAWSDNVLLVWRTTIPLVPEQETPLPAGMGLPENLSRAKFAELFQEACRETQRGVMLGMKWHVFVARKK